MKLRRAPGLILALVLLAVPPGAEPQPPKMPRIGVLIFSTPEAFREPFHQGLRELGYIDGQNVVIEYRWAGGRADRLADLATELVRLNVDVIVATPTPAVAAAKKATTRIPIVMAPAGDPVGTGLVASLARPGGNVTGVSGSSSELAAKRLELIREILPGSRRIAALVHATDPFGKRFLEETQTGARSLGVQVQPVTVRSPPW